MAIDTVAIGVAAGAEVRAIFRDGLETLRAGEAQYLVSGQPESVSGALSQAAGRSACRIYGTGSVDLNPRVANRYERTCRPYLDSIGQGEPAKLTIPHEGGQCPGVPYGARYSYTQAGGTSSIDYTPGYGQFLSGSTTLYGPITYVGAVETSTGAFRFDVRGFTVSGVPLTKSLNQGGVISRFGPGKISGLSFERLTAGTECGPPPPTVTPPTPGPDLPGPSFRFNPSPRVDVQLDTTVNIDGSITFNFGTGPISVDPFSDNPFDDGRPSGGSGGGTTAPPPGDIGDAGGASDTGAGGEAAGEAGPGEVLVGLKIDVLVSRPNARQYADGVFRGAGYIYMGVSGNLDQDYGGSMLKSGQFFFAEKENLTHWVVSANNGYSFRVTPYYREVSE